MKNIRIIKTNVNVSKILEQLKQYPEDWGSQKNIEDAEQLDPTEYIVTVDVLTTYNGWSRKRDQYVGNTEICIKTPAYEKHTEILNYLRKYFKKLRRCGFLALPIGGDSWNLILTKELIILRRIDITFPFRENTSILLGMKLQLLNREHSFGSIINYPIRQLILATTLELLLYSMFRIINEIFN
jgi:hypothetical protein